MECYGEKTGIIIKSEETNMKMVKDKQVLVGSDLTACPLKDEVVRHLRAKGWEVTDVGVQSPDEKDPEMYHRIGFKVGAMISEGEFERALLFDGAGMACHIAANKCPHVHAAVVESIPSALRCVTANHCNVLSMGSFYTTPQQAMAMADAFLEHSFGDGYEDWDGFLEYHLIGYEEIENFDYEEYKQNGFKLKNPRNHELSPAADDFIW